MWSHRGRLEEQDFGAFQHQEAWPVTLPVQTVADNTLVYPAHVLDAVAESKVSVVELHL